MHYLITGGAGFIGAHLTESLLSEGHSVSIIDNLSTGSLYNLSSVINSSKLEFIEDDIIDSTHLKPMVEKCDAVFHLAAAVGVELVVHDPVRTIVTNVHGTENVLKACCEYNKRVIVASTSEVYGKSDKATFSESDDLLIGPSTHSRWSYACSKLLDEFYVMAFHKSKKLPATVVRLFNTVGPRQTGQYGMVVPRFVQNALENKAIRVFGDGTQTRCFCHVFDTVRALKKLINTPESSGKIFNIGSTHSISITQLAQAITRQLESSSEIVYIPYEQAYEKGFEDMLHRAPNVSAIKDIINWQAELSLQDIISDVAENIRKNKGE